MVKIKEENEEQLQGNLKRIAKTSAIVFFGIIIAKALSYVYRIVAARNFGPEGYGLFSLAMIVSSVFITIASFGLASGSFRFLSLYKSKEEYEKMRYVFRFTKRFIIISSIVFGILSYLLAEYISLNLLHNENLIPFLKIFSVSIPFSAIMSVYLSGLRAFEEIGWGSFISNIFQNIVKLGILIFLIFLGWSSESIAISHLTTAILSLGLTYYVCRIYAKDLFIKSKLNGDKTKKKIVSELISYSWPLVFLGSIILIFDWADSFVIGYFNGVIDVGFYNIAYSISTLFVIVPELFMQLFLPLIIKEYANKNNKFIEEMSKQVGKWIFMINIPLFIIMILFPGAIINILFGEQYFAAKTPLVILAIGGFLSSLFIALCNNLISMKGKSKLILFNLIGVSIFNLILNIILVPKYGMNGAAFSTSLTWLILTTILLFEVKSNLNIIPLRKKMLNVVIASFVSLLVLIAVRYYISINLINLILVGMLFLGVYFISLYLMRCFDRHDLMIINSIKNYIYKFRLRK